MGVWDDVDAQVASDERAAADPAAAQPAAAPAPSSVWDVVDEEVGRDTASRQERLRKLFELGLEKSPDEHAQVSEIARQTRLSAGLVEGQLPVLRKAVAAAKFDPVAFERDNADLASLLLDYGDDPTAKAVVMQDGLLHRALRALGQVAEFAGKVHLPGGSPQDILAEGSARAERWASGEEAMPAPPKDLGAAQTVMGVESPSSKLTGLDRITGTSETVVGPEKQVVDQGDATDVRDETRTAVPGIYGAAYDLAAKQIDYSNLGAQVVALKALGQGDRAWELEKQAIDMKRELGARYYGAGPLEQIGVDAMELLPSQLQVLKGGGVGGALAAGVAGGVTLAITRSYDAASKAARKGWQAGSEASSFLSSFTLEMGGAYLDYGEMRTDDGKPVAEDLRVGAAVGYGLIAAAVEVDALKPYLEMFGPLGEAVRRGERAAFREALLKNPTWRNILADAGKRWVAGAYAEGKEEVIQQIAQDMFGWYAKSRQAGSPETAGEGFAPQKMDIAGTILDSADIFAKTVSGTLLFGAGPAVSTVVQHVAARDSALRSGKVVELLTGLSESPSVRAAPELVAEAVLRETSKSGEPVKAMYVDAGAFVRLFQDTPGGVAQAAADLGIEEQSVKEAAAGANGGRIEIPVAKYLETWGPKGVAQALAADTAVRPGLPTLREQVAEDAQVEAKRQELVRLYQSEAAPAPESPEEQDAIDAVATQLARTGVYDADEARKATAIVRAFVQTQAAVAKVDPKILFEQYVISVDREEARRPAPAAADGTTVAQPVPNADARDEAEHAIASAQARLEAASDAANHAADQAWQELGPDHKGAVDLGKLSPAYAKAKAEKVAAEKEIARWQKRLKTLGGPRDLVVIHNLSAENLLHAVELGGLAAPSIALTRAAAPLEGFGEISLIGGPDFIDPKAGMPVFDADVYSPRWPTTRYRLNEKALKAFVAWVQPFAKLVGNAVDGLSEELERNGSADLAHTRQWQSILGAAWLAEQGQPVEAERRAAPLSTPYAGEPALREFFAARGTSFDSHDEAYLRDLSAAAHAALESWLVTQGQAEGIDAEDVAHLREIHTEASFGEDGLLHFGKADRLARESSKVGATEVDTYATERKVQDALAKAGGTPEVLAEWARPRLEPLVGDPYIAKWTATGNVRKIPYTLENVLKELTRKIRAGEDFNYGLGTARSMGAKKFKSLEQIMAARDSIVAKGEFEAAKKVLDERFGALVDALKPYHADPSGFRLLDSAATAIGDSYKRGSWMGKALRENAFTGVPAELEAKAAQFAHDLLEMPTEYFEAKPQRAVSLSEFSAAVVPEGASPAALEALRKAGLKVFTYAKDDEGDRARAIEDAARDRNVLFQSAFHGTPHRGIEQFLTQFIGTGEGSQVFGWGLYFAGNRDVAELYRKNLSQKFGVQTRTQWELLPAGEEDPWGFRSGLPREEQRAWDNLHASIGAYGRGAKAEVVERVVQLYRDIVETQGKQAERLQAELDAEFARLVEDGRPDEKALALAKDRLASERTAALAAAVDAARGKVEAYGAGVALVEKHGLTAKPPLEAGQLYRVELPDDEHLLDYDAPFAKQPKKVQDVIRRLFEAQRAKAEAEVGPAKERQVAAHEAVDAFRAAWREPYRVVEAASGERRGFMVVDENGKPTTGDAWEHRDEAEDQARQDNGYAWDEAVRPYFDAQAKSSHERDLAEQRLAAATIGPNGEAVDGADRPVELTGFEVYARIANALLGGDDRGASKLLNELGIPGLRFLDRGSRGYSVSKDADGAWYVAGPNGRQYGFADEAAATTRAEELRTRNYVVWDDTTLKVAETFYQPAWHGSPHKGIDRFSLQKIGTGEGAQAYGWGLYFAQDRELAEHYRITLSSGDVKLDGINYRGRQRGANGLDDQAQRVAWGTLTLAVQRGMTIADALVSFRREAAERAAAAELEVLGLEERHAKAAPDDGGLWGAAVIEKDGKFLVALKSSSGSYALADPSTLGPFATRAEAAAAARPTRAREVGLTRAALADATEMARETLAVQQKVHAFAQELTADRVVVDNGGLYKVDLPEDGELLDYDAPLSRQPAGLLEKLVAAGIIKIEKRVDPGKPYLNDPARATYRDVVLLPDGTVTPLNGTSGEARGSNLYEALQSSGGYGIDGRGRFGSGEPLPWIRPGMWLAKMSPAEKASRALDGAGIPGLRFLDAASRNAGQGTHNFVMWNEDRVEMLERKFQRRRTLTAEQAKRLGELEALLGAETEKRAAALREQGAAFPEAAAIASVWERDATRADDEIGKAAREALYLRGYDVYQQDPGQGPRGYVDMMRDGLKRLFDVVFTARADRSTFLHESGHIFLEMMGDLAERPGAEERLVEDWKRTLSFLGVANRSEIAREHHEKWAHAFERYLMEGKAPSLRLVGAFQRFKLWLKDIYSQLTAVSTDIDDEIRGVFDRLLATDTEIERAKAAMGAGKPLFRTPDEAGMTPEAFVAYLADREESFTAAAFQAERRAAEEKLRATDAYLRVERSKAVEDAGAEFEKRPEQATLRFLRKGETGGNAALQTLLDMAIDQAEGGAKPILTPEEEKRLAAIDASVAELEVERRLALEVERLVASGSTREQAEAVARRLLEASAGDPTRLSSFQRTTHLVVEPGEKVLGGLGEAAPNILGAWRGEALEEGQQVRSITLPSWLSDEEYLANPSAWAWAWAALEGKQQVLDTTGAKSKVREVTRVTGQVAPEAVQRLVFDYMSRAFEAFPDTDGKLLFRGWMLAKLFAPDRDGRREALAGSFKRALQDQVRKWLGTPASSRTFEDPLSDKQWSLLSRDSARFAKWRVETELAVARRPAMMSAAGLTAEEARVEREAPAAESKRAAELEARLAALRSEGEAIHAASDDRAAAKVRPKLDHASVISVVGADVAKEKLRGLTQVTGGLAPDELAQILGVDSGEELVKALAQRPERKGWVDARAEELLRERRPDVIAERDRLAEVAAQALHNSGTSDWLLKEWVALKRRAISVFNPETGKTEQVPASKLGPEQARTQVPLESIRLAARDIAEAAIVGEINAGRALAAERNAADRAAKAAAAGNFQLAYVEKQKQLLNHYLFKYLAEGKEARDAFEKLGEKLTDPRRSGILGKAGGVFLAASDSMLEAFGFKDRPTDPAELAARPTMPDIVKALEDQGIAQGFAPARLSWLVANPPQTGVTRKGKPIPAWKGLTVADVRLVGAALSQLYVAARDLEQVALEGKRVEIAGLLATIATEAAERLPPIPPGPGSNSQKSFGDRARARKQGLMAALRDPEAMLRELGPTAYRFFWNGYLESRNHEDALAEKVFQFIDAKWGELPAEMQRRRFDLLDAKDLALVPFPADVRRDGARRDRMWAWMVALNMGNRSNMDRLLGGYGWEEGKVREFLDKVLSPEEWDFIESVWHLLDKELYPHVAAQYEKVNGVKPEKIEALPFTLSSGRVVSGGYFPARYDPVASRLGENQRQEALSKLYAQKAGQYSIAKSFTKERAKKYEDVVNLQWGEVPRHVGQVLHYIATDSFMRDAGRVMGSTEMKATVEERLGERYYPHLEQWLRVVASDQADAVPEHLADVQWGLGELRSRFVMQTLGLSLTVAAGDLANPLVAIAQGKVKARYMTAALAKGVAMLPAMFAHTDEAHAISAKFGFNELNHRRDNMRRKMKHELAQIGQDAGEGFHAKIRELAWVTMEATDLMTATIIWQGAYDQAMAQHGGDQGIAAKAADEVVRGQLPSHNLAEQPAFLRDKRGVGALVAFYGYFSKLYNVIGDVWQPATLEMLHAHEAGENLRAGGIVVRAAGRTLAIICVTNLLSELLSGRGPEDDEGWSEWMLRKIAGAPFGWVPLVGSVGEEGVNRAVHKAFHGTWARRSFSMRGSPLASGIERVARALGTVLDSGKDVDRRLWAALEAYGFFANLPLGGQITRTGNAVTGGEAWRDAGRGKVVGAAGDLLYGKRVDPKTGQVTQPKNPASAIQDVIDRR